MPQRVPQQAGRWVVVPLTFALGVLFQYLHVPAGWILAAIVVAGGCALLTQDELRVNPGISRVGRSMIAILAAAPIVAADPKELVDFILRGLAISVITIGIGFVGVSCWLGRTGRSRRRLGCCRCWPVGRR